MVRRQHLRFTTGRGFFEAADLRRAVELARSAPDSWQHAFALAELAHAELWHADPGAHETATAALEHARAGGDPRALAYALAVNAMLAVYEDRQGDAQRLGPTFQAEGN